MARTSRQITVHCLRSSSPVVISPPHKSSSLERNRRRRMVDDQGRFVGKSEARVPYAPEEVDLIEIKGNSLIKSLHGVERRGGHGAVAAQR